ncbi:SusC/RagA family TonB-linked outer membrane protein [Hymenobacter aerilatus]|uniref:SusC/RagA family TonB-linked outer membrane protein n=1 Tax=Hymenobacter aerilatus TaxID=2932251 RepID=A0A8T9T0R3_9BACT|nr:SusC/RagA family TonB-linked outer membrane protein [Hymenobacter aerilatus]UOR05686.1 SusC/RagA family TonB-linked outer membrane protein [Hymenobacter aerilatus]
MKKGLLLVLFLITVLLQQAVAQDRAISGRVTDRANSQGLPGVTVLVKGTTIGVSTNEDGVYSINVPASATTLVFSSIGYVPVEQPISSSTINVALGADSKQLGEVVVTGALGIERQARELGYSTATVDSKDLTQARVTNVTNGLAGKVAGLQIQTVNNGINPDVRITLRGNRSLTGQNQALVVIDGVQQPDQNVLNSLNPDDIADITVLKGANAAALYGSQATNGALIVTTKKGGGGKPTVTFSHTSQFESISFWPKLQSEFGPGSTSWEQVFDPIENQQYGPRFDGSPVEIGSTLANGDRQTVPYRANNKEYKNFFNTGYQMQNGVSFSGGTKESKFFLSAQNLKNHGIVPKDKFERNSFRANASTQIGKLSAGFNVSYAQTQTNTTSTLSGTQPVYWSVLNTSPLIRLTQYKDWRNDQFANPNGYYNEYYENPYYSIDNNRSNGRQNNLIGDINVGYKATDWLSFQYRIGLTRRDQVSKDYTEKFTYTAFTLNRPENFRRNIPGYVNDLSSSITQVNSDLFVNAIKTFGDFSISAILGNNIRQNNAQYLTATANALSVPGIYNIATNRVGELLGDQGQYQFRQYAFFGDLTLGYKNFLFLHGSGRQENVSILSKGNRNYFYPSVDASVVFSEAIPVLKDVSFLDYGKVRAGYAKVGQVNLPTGLTGAGVANSLGAYQLAPVYNAGSGFPFGSLASYTLSNRDVTQNLQPEFTHSYEAGLEVSFLKGRVNASSTYYFQKSINQTLAASVPPSTGFTSYLFNAGEVQNRGVEVTLNFIPVRTDNFTWRVGGNYNYNNNEVIKVTDQVSSLALTSGGLAQSYAIEGKPFPYLQGSDYVRDKEGRVILTYLNLPDAVGQDGNPVTRKGWVPSRAGANADFGNTLPKHTAGFNTSFTYKGITLAGQAEYRAGYYIMNQIGSDLDFTGASARSAQYGRQPFLFPNSVILENGVSVPNTSNLTPGGAEFWANTSYNRSIASNYITKGNFFKLREVTLSYSLPASLLGSTKFIKEVNLNAFGRNLFLWVPKENQYTDPEFSFTAGNGIGINDNRQTPPTRFYGLSVSATL